ncbi:DUF4286 family protein [Sphingobacterium griseoflavum]|uniref:DUF4286 family protein n=1 Tax=Sphingobacterium griseoflavum TaxID=1474952 RepID=UPI001678A00C|nr:DUF4286 family protein [Sphingobacterium griseoflavum]
MILYNISIIVDDSSHDDLLGWIKKQIPQLPTGIHLLKMLDSPHDGTTYCLQITAEDDAAIGLLQAEILPTLQQYIVTKHSEKAFIFDSKMQYISID